MAKNVITKYKGNKTRTELLNSEAVATRDSSWETGIDLFMSWLPNPDFVLQKAGKTIEVFKELLSDPFIKGCLLSRKTATLSLEWAVEQRNADEKTTEFYSALLERLGMFSLFTKILDAPPYGYQVFEIMWELIDNRLVPAKLVQKPAEWFVFDNNNQLMFKSRTHPQGEVVPENKFLVVSNNPSYENPYGEAVLSTCFWPATFKKGGLKFWVTFTEKYGMPWAVAKTPAAWDEGKVDELIDSLGEMVQDGVLVVPEDVDVEVKFPSNTASVDIYNSLLQYNKDEISMAFLGHTKAGQSTPGELGNQNQAKEVRADITLSDKKLCESAVNELIKLVHKLNFESGEPPVFVMFEETDIDKQLAERDQIIYNIGVRFTPEYIKKTYALEDDDFTIDNESRPAPAFNLPVNKGTIQHTHLREPVGFSHKFEDKSTPPPDGQLIIDEAGQKVLDKSRELIGNLNKQVKDYLNGKSDFSDALSGLADMYPKLNTDELYEKLVAVQFAADLVGRFQVKADLNRI